MNTWPCGTPRSTNNAFSVLYEPRREPNSAKPPAKRGPKRTKLEKSVIALETPQERALRRILRKNKDTYTPSPTQADREKSARLSGRHLHLGRTL